MGEQSRLEAQRLLKRLNLLKGPHSLLVPSGVSGVGHCFATGKVRCGGPRRKGGQATLLVTTWKDLKGYPINSFCITQAAISLYFRFSCAEIIPPKPPCEEHLLKKHTNV